MNKAADIYLKENDKMAGFVRRFSDYMGLVKIMEVGLIESVRLFRPMGRKTLAMML